LAPAKSIAQMQQIIFNDYVDATLSALFLLVVTSVLVFGIRTIIAARNTSKPSAKEAAPEKASFETVPDSVLL
jgi:carbon starvation protein